MPLSSSRIYWKTGTSQLLSIAYKQAYALVEAKAGSPIRSAMQSEIKNPCSLSPSFLPEEICYSDERQVSLMDLAPGYHGLKAGGKLGTAGVASSTIESRIHLDSPIAKGLDLPEYCLGHGQNVNLLSGRNTTGAETAANCSLPSSFDHEQGVRKNLKMESATHLLDRNKLNFMGAHHENSLFSSSMSDLFSRKLMVPSNNVSYGPSGSLAASYYEGEETVESLGELEALTIGNLLPDDDDLLSGVTDGFDCIVRANDGECAEDLDLFSTVGGLELGEDGSLQRNSVISDVSSKNKTRISGIPTCKEHPFEEHPSRTLLVRNISRNAEDSELRIIFEQYGDIRSLYTACKDRGFVMVSYFDIRAAHNALEALQDKPLQRRKLDIHFSYPKDNPSEQDINLGALVVSTLDLSISDDELREIFGIYGEIKEIRGTPHSSENKYIEFYDIRATETAYHALSRSNMSGKQIKLEPGHPGGYKRLKNKDFVDRVCWQMSSQIEFSTGYEDLHTARNRLMQSVSSELVFERDGLRPQYHSLPNTLTAGFSGSLLGGASDCTSNGTLRGPCSIAGGPHNPVLDNVIQSGESSSVSNSLPSLVRVESRNQSLIGESGHLRTHLKFELHSMPNLHTHSLPEYQDSLANGPSFGSPSNMAANISSRTPEILDNLQFRRIISTGQSSELKEGFVSPGCGSCAPPGRHYQWSTSLQPQPQSIVWPNSRSIVNGICAALPQHLNAVPRTPSHMLNALVPLNNHHVGSAPSVNLWDRQYAYPGESPNATVFHPGSLGNMRISGNSPHPLEFVPRNMFPRTGGNCMDMSIPSRSNGLHPPQQRCMIYPARGQMIPVINSFESPNERSRNRKTDGNLSQTDDKKQFELDVERIAHGEDKRTTLMIRNIPNKYTSKMLLAVIDECHRGAYDFIYLPIDFKNKCNVGYAFINMTDPSLIVPFYQTFNGKKWEKFNSEKVASLAYARIQGKAALIAHFQNSSLMNEDKRCRPILFHTEGPNAGDQVPFPTGSNIRQRIGKIRASISEEDDQEIPPN